MKFLLQLIVVNSIVFSPAFSAVAYAGTEINNGGAGISINGKVATFYSAEMEVNPTPLETSLVMNMTGALVRSLDLPSRVDIELIENILPSFDRKYYAVTEKSIDQSTLKIIKEQYSKITNQPVENITIFALTDPATKITLLLPDYFKLNVNEQRAILFHESLWINERVKTYENMIEIERETQIFAEYPADCIPRYNLTKKIESIFNEKLWALNSIFKCQTQKYFSYTSAKEIPITDFASRAEINTLAQILLRSYFKMPADNQLKDLFINQINTNPNNKMFLASKTALVEAIQDQSISLDPIFYGQLLPFESDPLSQNNIELLAKNLRTADMAYGFSDYDLFRMILTNRYSAAHLRLEMTYDSINRGQNKIAE